VVTAVSLLAAFLLIVAAGTAVAAISDLIEGRMK